MEEFFILVLKKVVFFEVDKTSKFKSFIRLSLSCAFAFCASIVLCHATDLIDPISKTKVGTYDSSTCEVVINPELARFGDQGRLPKDTDFAIQRALHSYAPVNYFVDPSTATINQHPVVITSAMNGRDGEYDYEDFCSAYAFTPKKITFGEVVYDFSYTMEFSPENQIAKFPTGTLTISTNSNNTQRIYTPIVIAFGSTGNPYTHYRKGTPSIIKSINIIGNFEEIPRYCFRGMPFLESVDATETCINTIQAGAFDNCDLLKRIDLSNSATDYSIDGVGLPAYKKVSRRYMYKGGTHRIDYQEVKPDFEGNIRDVLEHKCTTINEEEERTINELMDDDCFMWAHSLCDTVFPCCPIV